MTFLEKKSNIIISTEISNNSQTKPVMIVQYRLRLSLKIALKFLIPILYRLLKNTCKLKLRLGSNDTKTQSLGT